MHLEFQSQPPPPPPPPRAFGIPGQRTPTCIWNSKMPLVVRVRIFSGTTQLVMSSWNRIGQKWISLHHTMIANTVLYGQNDIKDHQFLFLCPQVWYSQKIIKTWLSHRQPKLKSYYLVQQTDVVDWVDFIRLCMGTNIEFAKLLQIGANSTINF